MFGTTVFIMVLLLGPQLNMFCALGWQVFHFSKAREKVYSTAQWAVFGLTRGVFVERLYFSFLTWFCEKRHLVLVIRGF